jgi:mitogen-activated protein kinase kinase kinase 7
VGKGVSGTVFRAEYLGEQVAVKVMVNQSHNTALFQEIRVLSKLRHRFVVSFRGISSDLSAVDKVGSHIGMCIVMQLGQFGSIFNVLKESHLKAKFRPWSERLVFLAKTASGLHYLHSKKIIHRDMKAGNVLVTELFEPLIADFGLSCTLSDARAQGEGTLAYLAPELFDGEDHSTASDIYAFAMVVWFVTTASEPNRKCEEPWADKTNRGLQADVLKGKRPLWPEEIMDEEFERFRLVSEACSINLPRAKKCWPFPAFVHMLLCY